MLRRTSMALLAGLLLVACDDGGDDFDDEVHEARVLNNYLEAVCRLYEEPACQDNMSDTCGSSISFAEGDCEPFFRLALANCDGHREALVEHETAVEQCIAQLDGFDCAGDEGICVEGGDDLLVAGPCGEVDQAVQATCPQDTDTGPF